MVKLRMCQPVKNTVVGGIQGDGHLIYGGGTGSSKPIDLGRGQAAGIHGRTHVIPAIPIAKNARRDRRGPLGTGRRAEQDKHGIQSP